MVIVVGEVLMDVFDAYRRIGGAPFNFAMHLKQMGKQVRFITRIGDDACGHDILRLLERQHFDLDDIQIDPHHPTGTVRVTLDEKGIPQFDIRRDVAYDHLDVAAAGPIDWHTTRLIYFGSLVQRTTNGFRQIDHLLAQKGPRVKAFCDINLRPPHVHQAAVLSSLHRADLLKMNIDELKSIAEVFEGPAQDDHLVAWVMQRFGIDMLILTKGAQGSALYTGREAVCVPATADGRVVDTVGAGDAYAAVLAAGYIDALPIAALAHAAADFAAYICSQPGAVPEDPRVYAQLRNRLKGIADAK